ncbi:MAG: FHA domain-containing protein, partial [Myxococcota bacterium]
MTFEIELRDDRTVQLSGDRFRAGSDPRFCDLVLDGEGIEEIHCEVFIEHGALQIRDLSRSAGTRLGSAKAKPIAGPMGLATGWWILVGTAAFRVVRFDLSSADFVDTANLAPEEDRQEVLQACSDRPSVSVLGGPSDGRRIFLGRPPVIFGSSRSADVAL